MTPPAGKVDVRPAEVADDDAVLDLLGRVLGWHRGDRDDELFRWKHRDNVFGRSPAWVAVAGGELVAYRTLMRWEFDGPDGEVVRAVRAVDTVTDERFRGQGLFRTLTMHALDELRTTDVRLVFNTPNGQSRPGYLRMGWQVVGRLPISARPRGLRGLARMARARVASARWSTPTTAGVAAADVFDGSWAPREVGVAHLGLRTRRSSGYLAWRYARSPLDYRVWLSGESPEDGVVVFRLRQRGGAQELEVLDCLGPAPSRSALRGLRRATGADYALALGARPAGFVPVRGQGPLLTYRAVDAEGLAPAFDLALGDVELF